MLLALAILTVLIWLALLAGWHGFWRADQRPPLTPEPLGQMALGRRHRAGPQ
jgi:hypothetical protein